MENDAYIEHLSQVNGENRVISTEDIYSSTGALLLKKNQIIDQNVAVKLVKHKLRKSISLSVALEKQLDERELYKGFVRLFAAFNELSTIHKALDLDHSLRVGCLYFKEFPLVRQRLTVMNSNLPGLFQKAIAGAWYALAIAKQMDFPSDQLKQIFLAALVRDLGMMHIDPILFTNQKLDPERRTQLLTSHVLIAKIVLDESDKISPLVKSSVQEHHERCDGAGYPTGKHGSELGIPGQIVAMSDTVQEILFRFKRQSKNIANLEGFLTMNTTTFGEDVYKALVKIVRLAGIKPSNVIAAHEFPVFLQGLIQINSEFEVLCEFLSDLRQSLNSPKPDKKEVILKNFIERILHMQTTTGVPSAEYGRWIEYVYENMVEDAFPEMELLNSMYEELAWQIDQIRNYVLSLINSELVSPALKEKLHDAMSLIERVLESTKFNQKRG